VHYKGGCCLDLADGEGDSTRVFKVKTFLFSRIFFRPRYHGTKEGQFGPSTDGAKFGKSEQSEEDHLRIDNSRTSGKGWALFFALVSFLPQGLNCVKDL